jgi:hypothetical protein
MQVPCPKCKEHVELQDEELAGGVARTTCPACQFAFVVRLGQPAQKIQTEEFDAAAVKDIEGVKTSGKAAETAGSIGTQEHKFIPSDTRTSIKVDQNFLEEGHQALHEKVIEPTTTVADFESEIETELEEVPEEDALTAAPTVTEAPPIFEAKTLTQPDVPTESPSDTPTEPELTAAPATPTPTPAPTSASVSAPGATDYAAADAYLAQYDEGKSGRIAGMLITVLLVVFTAFAVFVLARNNWSLDLSNLDRMLARAFASDEEIESNRPIEMRGLEVTKPVVRRTLLKDQRPVLTATGLVHNKGTSAKRYIYVRASLMEGRHTRATGEAPADNVFKDAQLRELSSARLPSKLNPGGFLGRNGKIGPGQSVAYMVVLTNIPRDYNIEDFQVKASISRAELATTSP